MGGDGDADEMGGRDADEQGASDHDASSASSRAAVEERLRVLMEGGSGLHIAQDQSDLDMSWWDGCHVTLTVDGPAVRSQDSLLGPIRARARWVDGDLQVERKLSGLRIRETLLPPDDTGALVSVVELTGTGLPPGMVQRRVYRPDPLGG